MGEGLRISRLQGLAMLYLCLRAFLRCNIWGLIIGMGLWGLRYVVKMRSHKQKHGQQFRLFHTSACQGRSE